MPTVDPVKVFISYSHVDDAWREKLCKQLKLLERQGVIQAWHDRLIDAGAEWRPEIQRELADADIILLLVSADFLASDFCYDIELKEAIARHDAGTTTVLPIILRPCDWTGAPFAKLQMAVKDAKPVSTFPDVDEALMLVAKSIRSAAQRARAKMATKSETTASNSPPPVGSGPGVSSPPLSPVSARVTLSSDAGARLAMLQAVDAPTDPDSLTVCGGADCVVGYEYSRKGADTVIRPQLEYLSTVRRGGPIRGLLFTHCPFAWAFPALSVRIANKLPEPVHLVEAVLRVESCEPVNEAIPVVRDMSYRKLIVCNLGWKPMENAEAVFTVDSVEDSGDIALFQNDEQVIKLGTIETAAQASIESMIPERLKRDQAVKVAGTLSYGPAGARTSVAFSTRVELGLRTGKGVAPTQNYSVMLRAGEGPCEKRVSIAQEIGVGEVDLFTLTVGADRSLRAVFSLSFVTMDGDEIPGDRMDLEVFMPRTTRAAGAGSIQ